MIELQEYIPKTTRGGTGFINASMLIANSVSDQKMAVGISNGHFANPHGIRISPKTQSGT